jgi:hypothetical protein
MRIIRQGDILLIQRAKLPAGARRQLVRELRLPGETGHAHVLTLPHRASFFKGPQGQDLVEIPQGAVAVLEHEEHPPVELPGGIWEIRRSEVFNWVRANEQESSTWPRRVKNAVDWFAEEAREPRREARREEPEPTRMPYAD